MNVKSVSITKSLIYDLSYDLSPEDFIVYIARISAKNRDTGSAFELIKYLLENEKMTPFEMVDLTVEITTSRKIAKQILKHQSFSFHELGYGYPIQLRMNEENKGIEYDCIISVDYGNDIIDCNASDAIENLLHYSESVYEGLINAGISKESARFILPIMIETKIYMKGTVRNWIYYLTIWCTARSTLPPERKHTTSTHTD
ncbi:MAG: FAD-dependent thymidylate synthase [Shewanella sp.]